MKSIAYIFGTRPEIIKLSPMIGLSKKFKFKPVLIHTNQHYDFLLDQIFFKELRIQKPDYNLKVQGSPAEQIGQAVQKLDEIFKKNRPDVVVVQGDTNSTLSGAIAANKNNIPLVHIEAGLRSFDKEMPEEHNRIMVDHISDMLFTVTKKQTDFLKKEGISKNRIHQVGNTIVDQVKNSIRLANKTNVLKKFKLEKKKYFLATIHRPSNVDKKSDLKEIIELLEKFSIKENLDVLWPVHPRTLKKIKDFKIKLPKTLVLVSPVGYFEFLSLIQNAKIVITDSGGIQEEACILGIPCITVRYNTERPETLEVKSNFLIGRNYNSGLKAIQWFAKNKKWRNPFGDGKSSIRILKTIKKNINSHTKLSQK